MNYPVIGAQTDRKWCIWDHSAIGTGQIKMLTNIDQEKSLWVHQLGCDQFLQVSLNVDQYWPGKVFVSTCTSIRPPPIFAGHWCTGLFMCNTVHIRRYNVQSHWKVQGRNCTPGKSLESLIFSQCNDVYHRHSITVIYIGNLFYIKLYICFNTLCTGDWCMAQKS